MPVRGKLPINLAGSSDGMLNGITFPTDIEIQFQTGVLARAGSKSDRLWAGFATILTHKKVCRLKVAHKLHPPQRGPMSSLPPELTCLS